MVEKMDIGLVVSSFSMSIGLVCSFFMSNGKLKVGISQEPVDGLAAQQQQKKHQQYHLRVTEAQRYSYATVK